VNYRLIAVVAAAFLVGALAALAAMQLQTGGNRVHVETTGKALVGGPFNLIDQNGRPVTDQDFRGKHMLVFFGFTHCPDICPAELQVVAQALDDLGPKAEKITPVFITVDPERDTPKVIKDYLAHFGEDFVGLTGSREAVDAAAKAYRVYHAKVEAPDSATDYNVDHSAIVYLMSPEGEYLAHYPYGTTAAAMAEGIGRHL
jgi:protein SCO1